MTYRLSTSSQTNLNGVHPDLAKVVRRAIDSTRQDFTVHEGLRTKQRQKRLVAAGYSQTMRSRHLTGDAVDLVPWTPSGLKWEWPLIFPIAVAMRDAARAEGVKLRWGGCWDCWLNDLDNIEAAQADYVQRRIREHKRAFVDGPHFEIPTSDFTPLVV